MLSNKDFYLLGLIIENIPQIKSVVVKECLLMVDQLFNTKDLAHPFLSKHPKSVSFEEELVNYLRMGLKGRSTPLDLVLNLVNISEMDRFSYQICNYYTKIYMQKKRWYEELAQLLYEFPQMSVQFRIYSKQAYVVQQMAGSQEEQRVNLVYDQVDRQFIEKMVQEGSSILFFTLKQNRALISSILQNRLPLSLDLSDTPFLFEIVKEFDIMSHSFALETFEASRSRGKSSMMRQAELTHRLDLAKKQETESQKIMGQTAQDTAERTPNDRNVEAQEFSNIITQVIQSQRYIEQLKFRVNDVVQDHLTHFYFNSEQFLQILSILKENSHFQIMKNLYITSRVDAQECIRQVHNVRLSESLS